MSKFLFSCCVFILLVAPTLVVGECTCDTEDEERNKSEALKYKLTAIASILIAGAIGVCLPIAGRAIPSLRPEKDIFFIIKAFAAGVILSTGFIHVLPDAFENLTSPCLNKNPWDKFPFTGFVAMMAAIGTLMVDAFATSYYQKSNLRMAEANKGDEEKSVDENGSRVHVHTHATHGHAHGSVSLDQADTQLLRHRVISQVLELGIVVHSVIIGISLGTSESPKTIKPLVAALTFHQFFEGMGLGGCISQAKFKGGAVAIMVLFFSLTTPVGIGIGIGISNVYDENSPTALIVEGVFNAASAGILIYMSLVDLLAADFMNPKMQTNLRLQIWSNISLLLGAGSPTLVVGECTCDTEDEERNKSEALKYKLAAIASILIAGAIGVCLPIAGRAIPSLRLEKDIFFIIKGFAAGVILSTGFIHVLPDAFESLTSPCLNENTWGKFPFTGFVAMMAAIGTLMVDAFATSYYQKSNLRMAEANKGDEEKNVDENGSRVHVHTHATHGHAHGSVSLDQADTQLLRHRVISQVLELGIVVHSVIIGISLGASESPKTIKPLVAALTFHQFFEGMGLGGCISQAKFKGGAVAIMVL
ncbi:hypothetical protein JRO89_XS12G0164300 [Xanthoceras sorbifolium]|uniref:Uncharacterized protein n=1 Tax=Xanthoceras sorbifolium TaxID=99658 RepID=A0ABQ8HCX3_9ROSI|nr:hypothetical protein JRO89_XS12G0164300 [Xanthoceras sorbifolium]